MMRFYINGWEEGYEYFCRIGRFTRDEWREIRNGEVVSKNGNRFYMTWED